MVGVLALGIAAGSLAAGAGSLALVWYLDRYRGSPGAAWFMLTLCAQTVWTVAYGVGLLVSDPALRMATEALTWLGIAWLGPLFLGFALQYTGRTGLFRSRWFQAVFAVPVGGSLLVLTLPFHDLLWRGFRMEPLFGLSRSSTPSSPRRTSSSRSRSSRPGSASCCSSRPS
ncbi:histidine kinase N-terminal 7TM domain-containing protein [Halobellus rufus]|uniref:histidine kinase N-terminal 7TM domain-containing protein n=1 Tax=Halobellus rufus TaxID=1448860 RepID=UPI001E5A5721|nr:histidine kinase N-terminal 7TM domain-containing protein [Halobellus rufus]